MKIKNKTKHIVRNKILSEIMPQGFPANESMEIPDDIAQKLLDELPQYFEKGKGRKKMADTPDNKAMDSSENNKGWGRRKKDETAE